MRYALCGFSGQPRRSKRFLTVPSRWSYRTMVLTNGFQIILAQLFQTERGPAWPKICGRCSYKVLERSQTIDETGYLKWDACLVLLLAWIICCLGVIKGVKSSGKVLCSFDWFLIDASTHQLAVADPMAAGKRTAANSFGVWKFVPPSFPR